VWGAAEAAIDFFEQHWDALVPFHPSSARPLRVLELGAGCGKLGLTVALNNGPGAANASVLLTEQPDGLAHLERNVRLNTAEGGAIGADARAVACNWGDFDGNRGAADGEKAGEDSRGEDEGDDCDKDDALWRSCTRVAPESLPRADVIIGSDLIYLPEGARALPRTIAALLRAGRRRRRRRGAGKTSASGCCGGGEDLPDTVAFYAHTRHRFDALDVALEEECVACGLEMVELDPATGLAWGADGDGRGRRPSSPPPFTQLFPEHRVAIYRLTLA